MAAIDDLRAALELVKSEMQATTDLVLSAVASAEAEIQRVADALATAGDMAQVQALAEELSTTAHNAQLARQAALGQNVSCGTLVETRGLAYGMAQGDAEEERTPGGATPTRPTATA